MQQNYLILQCLVLLVTGSQSLHGQARRPFQSQHALLAALYRQTWRVDLIQAILQHANVIKAHWLGMYPINSHFEGKISAGWTSRSKPSPEEEACHIIVAQVTPQTSSLTGKQLSRGLTLSTVPRKASITARLHDQPQQFRLPPTPQHNRCPPDLLGHHPSRFFWFPLHSTASLGLRNKVCGLSNELCKWLKHKPVHWGPSGLTLLTEQHHKANRNPRVSPWSENQEMLSLYAVFVHRLICKLAIGLVPILTYSFSVHRNMLFQHSTRTHIIINGWQ